MSETKQPSRPTSLLLNSLIRFTKSILPNQTNQLDPLSFSAQKCASWLALEATHPEPLISDPYAETLAGPVAMSRARKLGYPRFPRISVRTRYFDEFTTEALADRDVVVLLGAGMDMRAYRLPAVTERIRIFEIDVASVINLKEELLRNMQPSPQPRGVLTRVKADVTADWAQKLCDAGFQAGGRIVWLVEGLIYYLTQEQVDKLFSQVFEVSGSGSVVCVSAVTGLRPGLKGLAAMFKSCMPDPKGYLKRFGFEVDHIAEAGGPDASYGRPVRPDRRNDGKAFKTIYITAHKPFPVRLHHRAHSRTSVPAAITIGMNQSNQETPSQPSQSVNPPKTANNPTPSPTPPPDKPKKKPQYTLRARLREETEAPFRKARMFVYAGSALSAAVGAFIASLRVIAALSGVSGVQPLKETLPNVAINLAVIAICGGLLRFETKAGERRLERMSRGARIASLRVQDAATRQVQSLKEFRGRNRVVLVAGNTEKVVEAMNMTENVKEGISKLSLLVVPFTTDDNEVAALRKWRTQPYAREEWKRWLTAEREVVNARLGQSSDVLVIVVRLDGKVGARSVGAPLWPRLIQEISKLPKRDQYGKP